MPPPVTSTGSVFSLRLTSDFAVSAHGFKLYYEGKALLFSLYSSSIPSHCFCCLSLVVTHPMNRTERLMLDVMASDPAGDSDAQL